MDRIFKEQIGYEMEVYVDDMVVKSRNKNWHCEALADMFAVLGKHKLKLNLEKCSFGAEAEKFLVMLTRRRIEANLKKCEAVINIQSPKNVKTWIEECEVAFQKLKIMLATPSILTKTVEGVWEGTKVDLPYRQSPLGSGYMLQEDRKATLALIITARRLRPYFQSNQIIVIT
ncbi:Retrovirus-related Pol polyprotein from transposon opus, partial [Mucuna pruriens]